MTNTNHYLKVVAALELAGGALARLAALASMPQAVLAHSSATAHTTNRRGVTMSVLLGVRSPAFEAVRVLVVALAIASLVAAAPLARPAHAATTFAVDRNDDPDPTTANACTAAPDDCSLRGAIVAANASAGADTITVPAGAYTLTRDGAGEDAASTGDLDITEELTITGAGARTTSVAGGAAPFDDRIFDNLPDAKTNITGLTITGGKPGGYEGGGVRNQGDLTLDRVAVEDNNAGFAGGIDSEGGTLNLTDSTVSGNSANGNGVGGIFSKEGALNLTDSTVSGNSATSIGGLYQLGGTANITNSTISGNKTTTQAGFSSGVVAEGALVNIRNSTIVSNESARLGGGILTTTGATVFVKNTIVAGNSQDNCNTSVFGGAVSSQGNNISGDDSCGFTKTTDKQNTDPKLGPLADNGGPTDTHALLAGSSAIDAGTDTGCPATDQRGVTRPQGLRCDIGAFERDTTAPTVSSTRPAPGATGVPRNISSTATFSKQMDPATLTTSTVKLYQRKKGKWWRVTDTAVSCNSPCQTVTLNPYPTTGTDLLANKRYKVTITTGAKDTAGNALAKNYSWTFSTGSS